MISSAQLRRCALFAMGVVVLVVAGCRSSAPEGSGDAAMADLAGARESGGALTMDATTDAAGIDAAVNEFEQYQDTESGIVPIDAGSDLPDALPALGEGEDGLDGYAGDQPTEAGDRPTWYFSGSDAIRMAQRENLPLLMWMANSKAGSADRAIEQQVFATPGFEKMAGERFVGLKIDFGDNDTRASKYYRNLRERYKPRGAPVVILTQPDGTEYARYRGFKSKASPKGWIQRLEADLDGLQKREEDWIETLKRNGYRDWHDSEGRSFFGRLVKIDGDSVWFLDRFKKRYRVPISKLRTDDQQFIEDRMP